LLSWTGGDLGDEVADDGADATDRTGTLVALRTRVARHRVRRGARAPRRGLFLTLCMAVLLLAIAIGTQPWRREASGAFGTTAPPPTKGITDTTPLDLTQPFAGTPAATWANGLDGIQLPRAQAIDGYRAGQVADALARVKQVLVAAHLDPLMLLDHDPSVYLALLAPNTRVHQRAAISTSSSPDEGGEITLVERGFHLLAVPIKVRGSMTVSTDRHGMRVVHTNYVFAFPFAPANGAKITNPWQIDAVQHVAEDFTLLSGAAYGAGDRGLWITASHSYYESIACGPSKHGYLAPAYSEPGSDANAAGNPNGYYDPNHPLDITATCPG
jgi:hypothetical protein